MNKNQRTSIQFSPKKPQVPLPGLSCSVLKVPAPKVVLPQKKTEEIRNSENRVNRNVNNKLSFDKIDELTRPEGERGLKPPASLETLSVSFNEQTVRKSEVKTSEKTFESEEGLGSKFVLRNSQDLPPLETPKHFVLNLPEWPQMPEILAAAKEETEQEKQRSKWQEALYRYENQSNNSQSNSQNNNTAENHVVRNTENTTAEPQIIPKITPMPMPESDRPYPAAGEKVQIELPEILSARGLTKSYKKGKLTIPVLCGVDLTIGKGEFVSVAGQSGSGKSTLLHLLGTLDKPDSGSIYLEGQRIDNVPQRQRDIIRNRYVGFIFQFYHLLPELTTLENVLSPLMIREGLWGYFTNRKSYIEQGREILNIVGLSHRLNHKPSELSGGEIQRAAIARALVASPKVLLADEPTGNLDSKSAGEIIGILQQLNQEQGLTIVMITHDNIIAKAADRMVRMVDGVIVNEETAHLEERLLHHSFQ